MFCSDKIQIFLGKIGIALRLTSISKYLKLIRTTFPSPALGILKMVSFPFQSGKKDGMKWRIAEQF